MGEMSGGDCPLYDTSHSSKGEESGRDVRWSSVTSSTGAESVAVQEREWERCQVVTVLRTIPPIAVQEQRVGEMSGGDVRYLP